MYKNLILILSFCLLLSCATTGPGGKQSFIMIPVGQEVAIGEGMAKQVDETEQILDDLAWQKYINEVGQKIVAVSDRKDITYHFKVIKSDQINAFAAPGGFIYFYTGLLKKMENEAEMAAVMAHEISHVVARHGIKRMQTAMGIQLVYAIAFGTDGTSDAVDAAIGVGLGLTFAGYSRSNEREADSYGIHYMIKSGYNPHGAVTMFEKLAAMGGAGQSVYEELVSSHPDSQERIAKAKTAIATFQPLPKNLILGTKKYKQMRSRLE